MRKSSLSSHNLGTFPSPGAPDYRDKSVGSQKGWCSERVPHPACSRRRNISAAALTPFYSGRTLPSKWEDAERWICSPVSGYGVGKKSILQQTQRRPKSKSGPLGPPGAAAYYSNYSPAVPVLDGGGGVRNLVVGSPFSTGVFGADGLSVYYGGGGGEMEKNVGRSTSGPGWSDLLSESYSLPSSQDECADDKLDGNKDEENMVSRDVSRRDMATQMSPEDDGSNYSTPKGESPTRHDREQHEAEPPSKVEVRDVQVDKRATIISWSRRHGGRTSKKHLPDAEDSRRSSAAEARASSWAIEEAARDVSKLHRDEAKITAWENLQKAKAEAAIRKLEMKLEKKRSSSMDKILNELKTAQVKAQKMRSSVSGGTKQDERDKKIRQKVLCFRRHAQSNSLIGCFSCHAF